MAKARGFTALFDKLTETEARAIATKIANSYNSVHPNIDYDKWIVKYMETYDKVMNAIENYSSNVSDD